MITDKQLYSLDDLFTGNLPEAIDLPEFTDPNLSLLSTYSDGVSSSLNSGELISNTTVQDGFLQSNNFVTGSAGWKLTPTSGEMNFAISVDSLDIPDTTTANSFHVNSTGDAWWGATAIGSAVAKVLKTGVATFTNVSITGGSLDINSGVAGITSAGVATFKSVSVGGSSVQYTMNDYGLFSFGDGSDGALSTTGDVTLTADKYYTNLTINNGHTFNPAGYRVFCNGTFTLKAGGILARSGVNGSNASGATGGAGGTALADGYLKGSLVGAAGSNAGTAGIAGGNTANSIGSNGVAGGDGGGLGGGGGGGGSGGAGGTATASNVKLIANWHLATLLDVSSTGATLKYDNSAAGGGGRGGENGTGGSAAGAGGGAGSGGGIIAIYARIIVIEATGILRAIGGNGGNGTNGTNAVIVYNAGGGGGGAGGNGGQIILVYNTLSNAGTISVAGGTGGTHGNGGTGGTYEGLPGTDGTAGSAGLLRQFQLSL